MKKQIILMMVSGALLASSCAVQRDYTYLQDMEIGTIYEVAERPDEHITEYDRLSIVVTCNEPALAAPFNLVTGTFSVDPMTGEVSSQAQPVNDNGYLVDKNGNINYPVLGLIHVAGMTLKELEEYIASGISELQYIKDPIVLVDFLNFQFTVLGESGVGNYTVHGNNINLLQAIAMSGDIKATGKKDDIWVIRTENGHRQAYTVNLLSKDLFDSPVFYLQQNDIIYAKKNPRTKREDRNEFVNKSFNVFLTLLSTTASIVSVLYWTGVIDGRR